MTNITMTKGDTYVSDLVIKDAEGHDYTPAQTDVITFALKRSKRSNPFLTKTIDNSLMTLTLLPSDTESLQLGEYFFAVVLEKSENEKDTVIQGTLTLTWGAGTWTEE